MTGALTAQDRARELVDDLVAAGARFTFKPAAESLPASFTYELDRGADRWRCRGIVGAAKGDTALWAALVDEIGRRCDGVRA